MGGGELEANDREVVKIELRVKGKTQGIRPKRDPAECCGLKQFEPN